MDTTGIPEPSTPQGPQPYNVQKGIVDAANALQIDPVDLATFMFYETGGSMDPMQKGIETKWGLHKGLIQFGEPQAKQYGVDFSSDQSAWSSQLGADGAVVNYMLGHGFKPGQHGPLNMYATINAGNPNKIHASDEGVGGAPGTVQDKFNEQMGGHRQNAMAFMGADPTDYHRQGDQLIGDSDVDSVKNTAGAKGEEEEPTFLDRWEIAQSVAESLRPRESNILDEMGLIPMEFVDLVPTGIPDEG